MPRVRGPVITIDGPAGAGKSTVAKLVAARLGLRHLDTGAMYRAVAWMAIREGIPLTQAARVAEMIRSTRISVEGGRVAVDGIDVSREIRTNEISKAVAPVANAPECRRELVRLQQEIGQNGGLVTEGRDQGSVVFPNAEFKFYLDASVSERARRRRLELEGQGKHVDEIQIRREIEERDRSDMTREVGPLRKPDGARVIDTTGLTIEDVVERICREVAGAR